MIKWELGRENVCMFICFFGCRFVRMVSGVVERGLSQERTSCLWNPLLSVKRRSGGVGLILDFNTQQGWWFGYWLGWPAGATHRVLCLMVVVWSGDWSCCFQFFVFCFEISVEFREWLLSLSLLLPVIVVFIPSNNFFFFLCRIFLFLWCVILVSGFVIFHGREMHVGLSFFFRKKKSRDLMGRELLLSVQTKRM